MLRSSGPVALAALALTAWLQARGVSALVGARLDAPRVAPVLVGASAPSENAPRSADPILARNPFDSTTGRLGDDAPSPTSAEAPTCTDVRVLAIAAADDSRASLALLRFGDEPDPRLLGIGVPADAASESSVVAIDPSQVTLVRAEGRCVARMFVPTPRKRPAVENQRAHGVVSTGAGGFAVDRATRDAIVEGASDWMRTVSVRPEKVGSDVVGLRIVALQPGSPVADLGVLPGDVLQSLNGIPLNEPEKMLRALGVVRSAPHLSVVVLRAGHPTQLDYDVR